MNSVETHSYKNLKIEIYQKQLGSFGYHWYGVNGEEHHQEGYDKTQYAVEAAQKYIDNQTWVNSTGSPIREVGK